jgi:hypothetical protein
MSSQQYRKLDIDLPRQPTVDQRPWLVAGIVMACVLLAVIAYLFFANARRPQNDGASPHQQSKYLPN